MSSLKSLRFRTVGTSAVFCQRDPKNRKSIGAIRRVAGDDLLQDAWVAALRRPPNPATPVRGWFYTVFRNVLRNRHRGDTRRRLREESVPSPKPYRQTVLLRYFEELSSAQIASRMNVPSGTVRGRLKTAVETLRDALAVQLGGEKKVERWLGVFLGGGAAWRGTMAATSVTVKWALGVAGALVGLAAVIAWRGETEDSAMDKENPIEPTPEPRTVDAKSRIVGKPAFGVAKGRERIATSVSRGAGEPDPQPDDATDPKAVAKTPQVATATGNHRAALRGITLVGTVRFTGTLPRGGASSVNSGRGLGTSTARHDADKPQRCQGLLWQEQTEIGLLR